LETLAASSLVIGSLVAIWLNISRGPIWLIMASAPALRAAPATPLNGRAATARITHTI
jgi:hypothetical protein